MKRSVVTQLRFWIRHHLLKYRYDTLISLFDSHLTVSLLVLSMWRDSGIGSVGCLKFLKETQIVLGEHSQVFHLVFQVGDTLDTHTECVAGIYLRIYAAGF